MVGITLPLRGRIREILLEIEANKELGTPELLERMENPPRNTLHIMLKRLENGHWLQSRLEKIPGERNPPRRFYRLSKLGKQVVSLHKAYVDKVLEDRV